MLTPQTYIEAGEQAEISRTGFNSGVPLSAELESWRDRELES
jgi:hypothetical protein